MNNTPNSQWPLVKIEDISERVAMGPFGSSIKVKTFVPEGMPIISGQHIHGFRVNDKPGFNFITEEHAQKLSKANVTRGDIVFTHAGNIGQVSYIPENSEYKQYIISQRQFYMRCDRSKVIPEFVTAYFKSHEGQHKLLANASQVGVPSIARPVTYLRSINIPLPSLAEQHAIADTLGVLNDRIENNQKMNETLEAMAQAIFRDWFVNFGPTRAKMEGRTPYLAPNIWKLFPDKLDDEGKPLGWKIGNIGECFDLTMGQSPPGDTYNENGEGLPFFQGRKDFGFRYPENQKYCSAPTRVAKVEDTLMSVRAPVGDLNLAWEDCCIGRGVASLRHLSGSRSFTYYLMQSIQQELKQYDHTGTVFGSISKKQLEAIQAIDPIPELVSAFESEVGPYDELIRGNVFESATLTQIRDALLPNLFSRKVRLGVEVTL